MIRDHLFFTYVAVLHVIWAVLLLLDTAAADATSTVILASIIPDLHLLSVLLISASLCALTVVYRAKSYSLTTVLLFTPQAVFVLLAATGAVQAMLTGEYADGVTRPHLFIAADQAVIAILACCHQFALVRSHAPVFRQFLQRDQ